MHNLGVCVWERHCHTHAANYIWSHRTVYLVWFDLIWSNYCLLRSFCFVSIFFQIVRCFSKNILHIPGTAEGGEIRLALFSRSIWLKRSFSGGAHSTYKQRKRDKIQVLSFARSSKQNQGQPFSLCFQQTQSGGVNPLGKYTIDDINYVRRPEHIR